MKRRFALCTLLLLAVMAVWAIASQAFATISEIPSPVGYSSTNPGALDSSETWWRRGWGQTLMPECTLNLPPVDHTTGEWVTGSYYCVDRNPNTLIDTSNLSNYYRSANPVGTHLTQRLDILGIYEYLLPPARLAPEPVIAPTDGSWWYHWVFYGPDRLRPDQIVFGPTITVHLGIDTTPPRPVTGLAARPYAGGPAFAADQWSDVQRVTLTWDPARYDDLAGVAYYEVLIDGVPIIPSEGGPDQGRIYELGGGTFASAISLEDAPAGSHEMSVVCVDRALNKSTATALTYRSDPDTPTIEILRNGGRVVGANGSVEASASDMGGVRDVVLALNGQTLATFTNGPPYTYTLPSNVTTGTLSATVRDMLYRTVTVTAAIDSTTGGGGSSGAHAPTLIALNGTPLPAPATVWTNLRVPIISFATTGTDTDRFAYTVDRSPSTVPVLPSAPSGPPTRLTADASGGGVGLDLADWQASQPATQVPSPGAVDPIDGVWFIHARAYESAFSPPLSTVVTHQQFAVDVTPPQAPSGLTFSPVDAPTWSTSTVRDIQWRQLTPALSQYDSLSGDARFIVTLDGAQIGDIAVSTALLQQYFTVSGITPGLHSIGVSVVDVAGNRGPETTIAAGVDLDTPTIAILRTDGRVVRADGSVEVSATDMGGIRDVVLALNGQTLATFTSGPPYIYRLPSNVTTGTLSATVRDMLFRTVTVTAALNGTSGGAQAPTSVALNGTPLPAPATVWTNLRTPVLSLRTSASGVERFAYTIDRSPSTVPELPSAPGVSPTRLTADSSGSGVALDLADWQNSQPTTPVPTPGAVDPIDGIWYVHARAYQSSFDPPLSTSVTHQQFAVDVTPPNAPSGLSLSPLGTPTWSASTIRDIQWNRLSPTLSHYDTLSGDARFLVTLDGAQVGDVAISTALPQQYFTVTGLAVGPHVIGVSVVDLAGNRGRETTIAAGVNAAPTVAFRPAPGTRLYYGATSLIEAIAHDDVQMKQVGFYVDGILVGTDATPTGPNDEYVHHVTASLTRFANGAHALTVVATDFQGLTSSASMTIYLDKIVSVATAFASGPNPFFPIRHDKYKDYSSITYRLSKRATVTLSVFDVNGVVVRSYQGTRNAGRNSFTWDGRSSKGIIAAGRFYYQLKVQDGYGNVSYTKKIATRIQSYELVKTAHNRVIVVSR